MFLRTAALAAVALAGLASAGPGGALASRVTAESASAAGSRAVTRCTRATSKKAKKARRSARMRTRRSRRRCAKRGRALRRRPASSRRKPAIPPRGTPAPPPAPAPAPVPVPPPPTVSPRPISPRLFGFNDNAVRYGQVSAAQDAELAAGAGANVERVTLDWRWLQPTPGQWNWQSYDAIYSALTARGIRPVFILLFAPSWALADPAACNQWAADCRYPPGRNHDEDWRELARRVAERYPGAAGIEIWNEPNSNRFWQPGPDPARYVELVREGRAGVRAASSTIPVVGGAFNDLSTDRDGSLSLSTFAGEFFRLGGAELSDAVSVHAYPWSLSIAAGSVFRTTLDTFQAIASRAGNRRPIWVTETGLSTTGTDARYRFSEAAQASGLVSIVDALAREPGVDAVMVHTLIETPDPEWSRERGYGVVTGDGRQKPAYAALAALRR